MAPKSKTSRQTKSNNKTSKGNKQSKPKHKRGSNNLTATVGTVVVALLLIFAGAYWCSSSFKRTLNGWLFGQARRVYGIDLSRYQENINWEALGLYYDKSKDTVVFENSKDCIPVSFIFLKATQGRAFDKTYFIKRKEAQKHGYKTGAYHILVNDTNIVGQAYNFIHTAKPDSSEFPPILDIESNLVGRPYGEYRKKVHQWLVLVEKETGGKPLIYCSDKIREEVLNTADFDGYHFWIARYDTIPPKSKDDWLFWQFTEKGHVKGIKGNVDVNLWKGTLEELEKWRKSCWREDTSERERIEQELDQIDL